MTAAEISIAEALSRCTFLPASWDKRFCRQMGEQAKRRPDLDLTDRQVAWLLRLAHKYRRQLPTRVIEAALDEMERQADRRVSEGKAALPDFTPARRAIRREKVERSAAEMPLFDREN